MYKEFDRLAESIAGAEPPSPDQLLHLAFGGDNHSASLLEARLKEHFLNLARKRGPDLADDLHEEVVQEMWLLVYSRGLHRYLSSETTVEAYLTQVHRNAVERVRAANRPPGARSRYHVDDLAGREGILVDHEVDEVRDESAWSFPYREIEFEIDLKRKLVGADPTVVRALTLIVFDGNTMTEAATAVGMTRQTLGRRLYEIAA